MNPITNLRNLRKGEGGAVAIIVAICLIMFIGFVALAIDIGHLYVVKNELQNAADAGALAGARVLYLNNGQSVNPDANEHAYHVAIEHLSENTAVDVNCDFAANSGDIQRGHWSFATQTFTGDASLDPVDLWNVSSLELDTYDPNHPFINAVQVRATRSDTPVASFFARIFGHESFQMGAVAVAYIGFAGTLQPLDVDQPIAICREALLVDGEYQCSIGRMINSGSNTETHETGGWTDFNQNDPCSGGTNADEVRDVVCQDGNPGGLLLGLDMATQGGQIQKGFAELRTCWENATNKEEPWNLTLPVITCPSNNVGTCEELVGAVNVNIVWISGGGEDPQYKDIPQKMSAPGISWEADPDKSGEQNWGDFVNAFKLKNISEDQNGNTILVDAPYAKKSIYFLPDCTPHVPAGVSGGENFGILAKIPVLVH